MIISIGLNIIYPKLTEKIIDDVIIGGDKSGFKFILILFLCITALRVILDYAKEYLFDLSSSRIAIYIRRDLFNHIQGLSFFILTV